MTYKVSISPNFSTPNKPDLHLFELYSQCVLLCKCLSQEETKIGWTRIGAAKNSIVTIHKWVLCIYAYCVHIYAPLLLNSAYTLTSQETWCVKIDLQRLPLFCKNKERNNVTTTLSHHHWSINIKSGVEKVKSSLYTQEQSCAIGHNCLPIVCILLL